jgi:hypothetical protein
MCILLSELSGGSVLIFSYLECTNVIYTALRESRSPRKVNSYGINVTEPYREG